MDMHAPLLLALTAVVAGPVRAQSAPDAHIVRPYRGDVLTVDGRLPTPRSAYFPPRAGWRYVPLKLGQRLDPVFYARRYVVARPSGLPAATGGRRWIRYGDDLVLVNIRSGRVLRVAPVHW